MDLFAVNPVRLLDLARHQFEAAEVSHPSGSIWDTGAHLARGAGYLAQALSEMRFLD
jgi:hypothetical protein